jgi:hypothetical protein
MSSTAMHPTSDRSVRHCEMACLTCSVVASALVGFVVFPGISLGAMGSGQRVMGGPEIDTRKTIENAPVGRYHLFLAVLIGLIVLFEGYGSSNAAYVIPYVMGP